MTRHIRLGVNVDHVATLRNARGGTLPDPVRAAHLAVKAGAAKPRLALSHQARAGYRSGANRPGSTRRSGRIARVRRADWGLRKSQRAARPMPRPSTTE